MFVPPRRAAQWRELIRQMLREGKSEEEIKEYFVTQYGVRVLVNEPPNKIGSYLVPVIALLVGAFMLYRGFKMWIKPFETESVSVEEEVEQVHQDEYIQKMEEELKKRK